MGREEIRLLNIGSGNRKLPGFINIDLEDGADIVCDVTNGLPFDDASVDGIYSEHFIEHISQADAMRFFRECRRILKPGGRLRLATPDLDFIVNRYSEEDWRKNSEMVQRLGWNWVENTCEQLNLTMRSWGHQWLYNEREMRRLAEIAGLDFDGRRGYGQSPETFFRNLEHRAGSRLICEFTRPMRLKSEKQKLVSILIPAYKATFFEACLQSALQQDYEELEIIVCDDSADDTIGRIVEDAGDERIRYYRNEENIGGRKNYLQCFEKANGNYVKFLNDDDLLHPHCVRRMVEAIEQYPQVTLVTSHRQLIDAYDQYLPDQHFNRRIVEKPAIISGISAADTLLTSSINYIGEPSTTLFRRSDALTNQPHIFSFGSREALRNGDVTLWVSLLSKGDLLYIPESLSCFRLHGKQVQQSTEYRQEAAKAWEQIRFDAERMGLLHPEWKAQLEITPIELDIEQHSSGGVGVWSQKPVPRLALLPAEGVAELALPDDVTALAEAHGTLVGSEEQAEFTVEDETEIAAAIELFMAGEVEAAFEKTGALLRSYPTNAELLLLMFSLSRKCRSTEQAAGYLNKLLILHPGFAPAYDEVGILQQGAGSFNTALRWFERALEINPECRETRLHHADCQLQAGLHKTGLQNLEELVKEDPDNESAVLLLVDWYIKLKQYTFATNTLEGFISVNPQSEAAIQLLYKLNHSLDESIQNTPEVSEKPQPVLAVQQRSRNASQQIAADSPIFVVGSPRSGTSVLAQSLGKHSQTSLGPESNFLQPLVKGASIAYDSSVTRDIHHWLSNKKVSKEEFFQKLGIGIHQLFLSRSENPRWIDQTPAYSLCLPELNMLLPNARFVHIIRDGRNVVHSMLNSGFGEKWSSDFKTACLTWKTYVLSVLEFERTNPDSVLRVYNEAITQEPSRYLSELQSGLALTFEEATTTLFSLGIKINSSFDNKDAGRSEWRDHWSSEQRLLFNEIAGNLLIALGYESDTDWVSNPSGTQTAFTGSAKSLEDIVADLQRQSNLPVLQNVVTQETSETRVSIIIPVYNKLALTHGCLKAILANTAFPNYEVIVVDNGSTDDTADYLRNFEDPRVRSVFLQDNSGYVGGCNAGADSASGQLLVFLNNDTEVQPGWLQALVSTTEERSDCGAVGAKLVYPNGTLQEAGSIVFSDGNGWNFGRNMNPKDPRFNYLREVDYCSGAALMVRRSIWDKLGGFDERYAPAYYEDTDLCFGVRKAGYKVYYQPQSVVVHLEGQTAGVDLQSGYKKYQVINRKKFVEKWSEELKKQSENHPGNVVEASNRATDRSILIVDPTLPFYDRASGCLRLFQIIEILQDMRFHITFVSISKKMETIYKPVLQQMGVEVLAGYSSAARECGFETPNDDPSAFYQHLLQERSYSYAMLDFWHIAEKFIPAIRTFSPQTEIIVDSVDIHFVREIRAAELNGDDAAMETARQNREKELAVYREADRIWVVTDADRRAIAGEVAETPIDIVPNIHRSVNDVKVYEDTENLLFVGNFHHPPNKDAIEYFCSSIWPKVSAACPDVKLIIAGNNSRNAVGHLESANIVVLGYVKDLDSILKKARISVNPLRYGAGMKGKIGEALSWGLPVVTTPIGAEGMELQHGVHAMIAEDAEDFAEAIIQLYDNEGLWQQLSTNGREHVSEKWGTKPVKEKLNTLFDQNSSVDTAVAQPGFQLLVSIVILTFNALEYTRQCIESIQQNTSVEHEIVFVDNASTDGTVEYLGKLVEENASYKLIANEQNRGFAAGNNQGVAAASGKYVLLLNNDVLVSAGWLEGLLDGLTASDQIGVIGPITNHISGRQMLTKVPYQDTAEFPSFAARVRKQNKGKITPRRRIAGFAMLLSKQLYTELEGFDETFGNGNFEDDDFCLRIREKGYAVMVDEGTYIHHFGSRTFIANEMNYAESLREKGSMFTEKWPEVDYKELLEQETSLVELHDQQVDEATSLLTHGKFEQAEILFRTIVAENPLNLDAIYGLSIVKQSQNQFVEALELLQQVVDHDEHCAPAFNDMGVLFRRQEQFKEAIEMFSRSIELDPSFTEAKLNMSETLIEHYDYENGIRILYNVLADEPENSSALLYLAQIHLELDNYDAAAEQVMKVLKIEPENVRARELEEVLNDKTKLV